MSAGSGWFNGAFSNREPFAIGAARGFCSTGATSGMETTVLQPGNALNSMLRSDRVNYLEKAGIAAIYSHGNVDGPDVEYEPVTAATIEPLAYWPLLYRWGDEGMLQWVFMQGCDTLGFARFPNGRPDFDGWLSPMRWSDAFQGLSGICGFRSGSRYVPSSYGLGAQYASTLISNLEAGASMWEAWRQCTSWLHASFGWKAEVACFVNDPLSLSDTLLSYNLERQRGLSKDSIQTQVVGAGYEPCYHYCRFVNNQGYPDCTTRILGVGECDKRATKALTHESPEVRAATSLLLSLPSLEFEASFDWPDLSALSPDYSPLWREGPEYQVLTELGSDVTSFAGSDRTLSFHVPGGALEGVARKLRKNLPPVAVVGSGLALRHKPDSIAANGLTTYTRLVEYAGQQLPVCGDPGIQWMVGSSRDWIAVSPLYKTLTIGRRRTIDPFEDIIGGIAQRAALPDLDAINVSHVDVAYERRWSSQSGGLLFPVLRVFYEYKINHLYVAERAEFA